MRVGWHSPFKAKRNPQDSLLGKSSFCSRSPDERYCQLFICSEHFFDPGLKPLECIHWIRVSGNLPQIKFPMSLELKRPRITVQKICTKRFATLRILIPEYNQSTVDPEKKVDITRRHHWFPREWRLRNERRNSILMTRHNPDLGSTFHWLKKTVVTSRNVDYFIRLLVFDMSIEVDG